MNPIKRYQNAAIDWLNYYEDSKSLSITLLQMQAFAWPIWTILFFPDVKEMPIGLQTLVLLFLLANLPFAVLSTVNFGFALKHHAEYTYRLYTNRGQTKLTDYQEQ